MLRSLRPALVAVLVVWPAHPAPKVTVKAATPSWPTQVGATLEYQYPNGSALHTETVTAVERVGGVTTVSVGIVRDGETPRPFSRVEMRKDGLFVIEDFGQAYDPPVCLLKLPVTKGEKWTTTTRRGNGGPIQSVREVGETRTIETPAGKFEAVRVASEVTADGQTYPTVGWYAPGVGVVQIENHKILKAVTPGK